MKTVSMLKTHIQENADGCRQVFGPIGKLFTLDDKTADALIDSGAAKDIRPPKKAADAEQEK
jgi:hypothetical protein